MELTNSFPPADKLIQGMKEFDYRKNAQNVANFTITVFAWIAAIATVLYQKWNEYDCNERVQLALIQIWDALKVLWQWIKIVWAWFIDDALPAIKSFYGDCVSFYNSVILTFE